MSDENSTHFQFRLGGIELEIEGDREFVERMYARIMQDITAAGKELDAAEAREAKKGDGPHDVRHRQILWVHRCSPMMHKIYMSSPGTLDPSPLFRFVDLAKVGIVFADKGVFEMVLPTANKGQTVWAELTEAGKKKIAAATPGAKS